MISALCVGAGGFIGATLRYLLGLLPWHGEFPLITFLINLVGSIIIGMVAEFAFQRAGQFNPNLILFLRTGFCGGFTTLSAMGVEAITLFDKGKYLLGGGYVVATMVTCLIGVVIGQMIMRAIIGNGAVA